jgi:hypothetical protein
MMEAQGTYLGWPLPHYSAKGRHKENKIRMKNKILKVGLPVTAAALLLAGIGVAVASAQGPGFGGMGGFGGGMGAASPTQSATDQATLFQNEASELGISESAIVSGWAQGQTLEQIATANGITAAQLKTDMQNFQKSQQQAQLQALVTNGTITQDQMNQRLQFEQAQQAKMASQMQNQKGRMGPRGSQAPATGTTPTTSTSQ